MAGVPPLSPEELSQLECIDTDGDGLPDAAQVPPTSFVPCVDEDGDGVPETPVNADPTLPLFGFPDVVGVPDSPPEDGLLFTD